MVRSPRRNLSPRRKTRNGAAPDVDQIFVNCLGSRRGMEGGGDSRGRGIPYLPLYNRFDFMAARSRTSGHVRNEHDVAESTSARDKGKGEGRGKGSGSRFTVGIQFANLQSVCVQIA